MFSVLLKSHNLSYVFVLCTAGTLSAEILQQHLLSKRQAVFVGTNHFELRKYLRLPFFHGLNYFPKLHLLSSNIGVRHVSTLAVSQIVDYVLKLNEASSC